MHGTEIINIKETQLHEMSVCLNIVYHRIFGMNRLEFVKVVVFLWTTGF